MVAEESDSDLLLGSWWDIEKFVGRPEHDRSYHGLFVPQVANQLIRRFTEQGDLVLDPFCGYGTTAVECVYLGRRSANYDILQDAVEETESRTEAARRSVGRCCPSFVVGQADATRHSYRRDLGQGTPVKLAVLHPPYHNAVKFSDDPADLCNCATLSGFLTGLTNVVELVLNVLSPGGHLALLMGDTWEDKEIVPLAFRSMAAVQGMIGSPFELRAICVKKIAETRAKRGQRALWKWRHLNHGTYEFEHETLFIFRKRKSRGDLPRIATPLLDL